MLRFQRGLHNQVLAEFIKSWREPNAYRARSSAVGSSCSTKPVSSLAIEDFLNSKMKSRYLAFALLGLFQWSAHVSAIHRMVQYRAFKDEFGLVERQDMECPAATETLCADGNGCCSSGAACYSSNGIGLCSQFCGNAAVTCTISNVGACCDAGQSCSPSGCVEAGSKEASSTNGDAIQPTTAATPLKSLTLPTALPTGCENSIACSQGFNSWCCEQSWTCNYNLPGFCTTTPILNSMPSSTFAITSTTSNPTLQTTSQSTPKSTSNSTSQSSTKSTSAAGAQLSFGPYVTHTAAAIGNFELNDWNARIGALVAAMAIAGGL